MGIRPEQKRTTEEEKSRNCFPLLKLTSLGRLAGDERDELGDALLHALLGVLCYLGRRRYSMFHNTSDVGDLGECSIPLNSPELILTERDARVETDPAPCTVQSPVHLSAYWQMQLWQLQRRSPALSSSRSSETATAQCPPPRAVLGLLCLPCPCAAAVVHAVLGGVGCGCDGDDGGAGPWTEHLSWLVCSQVFLFWYGFDLA